MHIAIVTFFYPPDICAGSFRMQALVQALEKQLPASGKISVLTTFPHRYQQHGSSLPAVETAEKTTTHRFEIPHHSAGGPLGQIISFSVYGAKVIKQLRTLNPDIVVGTSSRLMTAALAALGAWHLKRPLYTDIRDIFIDTLQSVYSTPLIKPALWLLKPIEGFTLRRSQAINLVSPGFTGYHQQRWPTDYTTLTNGIDPEFLRLRTAPLPEIPEEIRSLKQTHKILFYAGNIGEGQALEDILPQALPQLPKDWCIVVMGDGSRRELLKSRLEQTEQSNFLLLEPRPRQQLMGFYQHADALFLHLRDCPAFTKVLPSKLFEYGALAKPLICGVSGYPAEFIRTHLADSQVFEPEDSQALAQAVKHLNTKAPNRDAFCRRFDRSAIMCQMAKDIVKLMPSPGFSINEA